jgi:hypothetical protein
MTALAPDSTEILTAAHLEEMETQVLSLAPDAMIENEGYTMTQLVEFARRIQYHRERKAANTARPSSLTPPASLSQRASPSPRRLTRLPSSSARLWGQPMSFPHTDRGRRLPWVAGALLALCSKLEPRRLKS